LYLPFLRAQEPGRHLHLAIPREAWQNVFEEPIGQGLLAEYSLRLLIFEPLKELIVQWIPTP
jgi:XisH protein